MPPVAKLDLIPDELRRWLSEELAERGFGQIIEVTEALNFHLQESGQKLSIGKSAVGKYAKALKDQREAFSIAETLLTDMDLEAEGELHKVLLQMIATSAVHMIQAVREEDGHLDPKDLMNLGRMLKDLMASSGIREKIQADERERIAVEAQEKLRQEQADLLSEAASTGAIEVEAAQRAREIMGFG